MNELRKISSIIDSKMNMKLYSADGREIMQINPFSKQEQIEIETEMNTIRQNIEELDQAVRNLLNFITTNILVSDSECQSDPDYIPSDVDSD